MKDIRGAEIGSDDMLLGSDPRMLKKHKMQVKQNKRIQVSKRLQDPEKRAQ